jgi:hypothetical protein
LNDNFVKIPAIELRIVALLLFAGLSLSGHADPPLMMVHFERCQLDFQHPPMGDLGLPLGTFAVIEGVLDSDGLMLSDDEFDVTAVNGKTTDRPIRIHVEWPSKDADYRTEGMKYTLHGFEIGGWHSGIATDSRLPFSFARKFVISSIEKRHGAAVSVARPVDPNFALAQPNFSLKPDDKPPVGGLGLPLGTIATIKVHRPEKAFLMENPFEVESVNGVPAPPNMLITVRNLKALPGESVKLRGFETGEWISQPWRAPKGEFDFSPQAPFQFFDRFVVISIEKAEGPDAKLLDSGASLRAPTNGT